MGIFVHTHLLNWYGQLTGHVFATPGRAGLAEKWILNVAQRGLFGPLFLSLTPSFFFLAFFLFLPFLNFLLEFLLICPPSPNYSSWTKNSAARLLNCDSHRLILRIVIGLSWLIKFLTVWIVKLSLWTAWQTAEEWSYSGTYLWPRRSMV